MRIEVKQEHIDNGESKCRFCPVALAIQEQTQFKCAAVSTISWTTFDWCEFYPLPQIAIDFISVFDNPYEREYAKPFSFELSMEATC